MNALLIALLEGAGSPVEARFFATGDFLQMAIWLAGFALVAVGVWFGMWLVCLPLRRQQSAMLVLQIIENGLGQGHAPEVALRRATATRDSTLGLSIHQLVGWLERGLSLAEALDKVPHLMPRPVAALLQAGCTIGTPAKVLPACRAQLQSAVGGVQELLSGLWVQLLFMWPVQLMFIGIFITFALPKIDMMVMEMSEGPAPTFLALGLVVLAFHYLVWAEVLLLGLVVADFGARALLSSSSFPADWRRMCAPLLRAHAVARDWVEWQLPWRRKRLERDFSVLLAILLDSGMPEERAVTLAAEGTANGRFRARAAAVVAELRRGVKLTEAVAGMDDTGEFRWRLTNAAAGPAQFAAALTGWHETLEARAFRQEQVFAQTTGSVLVLVNGLFVGTLAVGIFQMLISLTEMVEGLW